MPVGCPDGESVRTDEDDALRGVGLVNEPQEERRCERCGAEFESEQQLRQHNRQEHAEA